MRRMENSGNKKGKNGVAKLEDTLLASILKRNDPEDIMTINPAKKYYAGLKKSK